MKTDINIKLFINLLKQMKNIMKNQVKYKIIFNLFLIKCLETQILKIEDFITIMNWLTHYLDILNGRMNFLWEKDIIYIKILKIKYWITRYYQINKNKSNFFYRIHKIIFLICIRMKVVVYIIINWLHNSQRRRLTWIFPKNKL